jgi:ATP-dependent DNA ligase
LHNALNKKAKLLYVVFDALFVGGKDIRKKPLLERKKFWSFPNAGKPLG